jgi:hypothetical protein
VIVLSSGELGLLSAMAEAGREDGGGEILKDDEYALDQADVDRLVQIIRQVDSSRDPKRIAKLTIYLPVSVYEPENEAVLRYLFGQIQILEQQGILQWATQRQVYEAFMAWEAISP